MSDNDISLSGEFLTDDELVAALADAEEDDSDATLQPTETPEEIRAKLIAMNAAVDGDASDPSFEADENDELALLAASLEHDEPTQSDIPPPPPLNSVAAAAAPTHASDKENRPPQTSQRIGSASLSSKLSTAVAAPKSFAAPAAAAAATTLAVARPAAAAAAAKGSSAGEDFLEPFSGFRVRCVMPTRSNRVGYL